ncbi:MAG: FtsW/RodA/SpoVE family cell cycle protein, partial [Elusimicrobia bacterium]|nr:FtsW/RodA/SpoVE family cell cycle protein [Elusimicrobiota bacterium]
MKRARGRPPLDYTLLLLTVALTCWGIVMIYSASAIWAERNLGRPFYFFERQLAWALVGFSALAFFSRFDYRRLRAHVGLIFAATCVALAAALLCPAIAGVHRWIRLG